MSVTKGKIVDFAVEAGYDNVLYSGEWRGYHVYEPVIEGSEIAYVGPPLVILVQDDSIRMSTEDEAFEYIDEAFA